MSQYKVTSTEVFKTGNTNGKTWTIFKIEVDNYPENGRITGFDKVAVGDMVTVEKTQKGEYTNLNYKAIKDKPVAGGSSPTDKRVLALQVRIAEQIGVPKEEIESILLGE